MPKTVLVTGAASGIGLASAKLLLQEGYQVMAFDPQEELMRHNLPEEGLISFFCGDIFMLEDCSDAVALTVKTFGQLDVLLHWGAAATKPSAIGGIGLVHCSPKRFARGGVTILKIIQTGNGILTRSL